MRALGIVVGLVAAVSAAVLAIALLLSTSNDTSWTDLEVGECFDLGGAVEDAGGDLASISTIDTVSCDEPHDAEVLAAGRLDPDGDRPYPTDDELFAEIDAACGRLVPDGLDTTRYGLVPIAPDETTWEGREGRFSCVAVVIGGGTVTGSALD